jgi:hypothetical protein
LVASGLRFAGIEGMDKAKRKPEPRESKVLLNIISLTVGIAAW